MTPSSLTTILFTTGLAVFSSRTAAAQAAQVVPAPATLGSPRGGTVAGPLPTFVEADAADSVLEGREADAGYGENGEWRPWCKAPCAVAPVGGYEFRVVAPGKVASPPFVMPFGAPINVYVRMGSKPEKVLGIVLTSVGGAVTFLAATSALNSKGCSGEVVCDRQGEIGTVAAGAIGVGLLATGIYLIVANSTDVILSPAGPPPLSLGGGLSWTARGLAF